MCILITNLLNIGSEQLNLRKMDGKEDNYLALTGPLPDKKSWAAAVPERLRPGILRWSPFQVNHSIYQYLAQAKWRTTWTLWIRYSKYDIECHMVFYVTMGTFRLTVLMNKWTNIVMDDGWVHPLAKTLPSLVSNLCWNVVMDDWNLDEKSLGKWQYLQHCKSIIPKYFIKNDK